MKTFEYIADSNELPAVAEKIAESISGVQFILLTGDLGAGKTTLVSELVKYYGVNDTAYSPTFSIINTYNGSEKIIHADLYRLKSETELELTGFYEEIEDAAKVFIEWAEKSDIEKMIKKYCKIEIAVDDDKRKYKVIINE